MKELVSAAKKKMEEEEQAERNRTKAVNGFHDYCGPVKVFGEVDEYSKGQESQPSSIFARHYGGPSRIMRELS
jgi:hypothetical protein